MITVFIDFTPPSLRTENLLSLAKLSLKIWQRNTSSNNIWTLSFTPEIFQILILNDSLDFVEIYSFSCHLSHSDLTSVWFCLQFSIMLLWVNSTIYCFKIVNINIIISLHINIINMDFGIINWASLYFAYYISLDFIVKSLLAVWRITSFLVTLPFALLNFFTLEEICCKEGPSCFSLQHPLEVQL